MHGRIPPKIKIILTALDEKKGIDLLTMDVRGIVSYTDFMVICSGSSSTHVNALVAGVEEAMASQEKPAYVNPSKDNSWWILDFVDVVVHVFKEETRLFYNLEQFWGDAKILNDKAVRK